VRRAGVTTVNMPRHHLESIPNERNRATGEGNRVTTKFSCPICGYPELLAAPFDEWGSPSEDSCPSCSYEFTAAQDPRARRADWIRCGMTFASGSPPVGFDPVAQLANAMHPLPRTWALLGDSYRRKMYGGTSYPGTSAIGIG